jgi:hypothetical protein
MWDCLPALPEVLFEDGIRVQPRSFDWTGGVDGERKVVTNAGLKLVVDDSGRSLAQAVMLAEELGGYVAETRLWSDDSLQYASAVIRVPASQSRQILEQLKQRAMRVIDETVTGEDVTEEYADLETRLRSLEATAGRVRGFLDAAESVPQGLAWQPMVTLQRSFGFLGKPFSFVGDVLIWGLVVGGPFGLITAGTCRLVKRLRTRRSLKSS